MQIDSLGNSLHEMSKTIFGKTNKKNINLSCAELAKRVVKVNLGLVLLLPTSMTQ